MSDLMAAIKSIKKKVKEDLKEAISEAIAPIYSKITGIEQNVKNVQNNLGETAAKVLELENKMENLTLDGGTGSGENGVHTEKMQKQIDDMSEK